MYRSICFVLTFALFAAPAAAQQHIVDAVHAANPQYLRINDHANDAKFLQCVVAAIPGAGYLSKIAGENGFTWPNGIRTSHDAIAFADGSRVDVIGGSDNAPTPGHPTWNPIPREFWRPSNVFLSSTSVPTIAACDGSEPIEPPPPPPPPDAITALLTEIRNELVKLNRMVARFFPQ